MYDVLFAIPLTIANRPFQDGGYPVQFIKSWFSLSIMSLLRSWSSHKHAKTQGKNSLVQLIPKKLKEDHS